MPKLAATTLLLMSSLATLHAQGTDEALPGDLDAFVRAAQADRDFERIDKMAVLAEGRRGFDAAGRLREASVAIRRHALGESSPGYGDGLIALATFEKRTGKWQEAIEHFQEAVRILGNRPEAAPALVALGVSMGERKLDEALDYFRRAEGVDPGYARAQLWIGVVQERKADIGAAEASYRRAAQSATNPDDFLIASGLFGQFLSRNKLTDLPNPFADRAAAMRRVREVDPPTAANVYRVGSGVSAPVMVSKIEPSYSEEARFARYQGTTVLAMEIDTSGVPRNIRVQRPLGFGLDETAMDAVAQWRFRPAMKDGQPVTVTTRVEVNFRLL